MIEKLAFHQFIVFVSGYLNSCPFINKVDKKSVENFIVDNFFHLLKFNLLLLS
jgi:hypothetical protein